MCIRDRLKSFCDLSGENVKCFARWHVASFQQYRGTLKSSLWFLDLHANALDSYLPRTGEEARGGGGYGRGASGKTHGAINAHTHA
eukprot:4781861-Amphidinium_carterae.1